jgi:branched-chain amino acid transport system substrate-binding protein
MRMNRLRLTATLAVLALVMAACGGDAGTDTTEADVGTETTEAMVETTEAMVETTEAMVETTEAGPAAGASVDGTLTIGTILPVTGSLAFLGPPEIAGARLAIEDINGAGGVLGNDVVLIEGDSGDDTQDIVNPEVDRLLAGGADAIVGAASSAVSKLVIDKIVGAGVIQFSPANTSDDFTTYDDNGLYFRTAPPDTLQGKVIADQLIAEGNETVGILFRQESYGQGLAEAVQANFEAAGGTVEPYTAYATDTENFDADVDALVAADPDAIVVIGFSESANILTTMNERGIGPDTKNVWGVDGNIGGIGAELADPSIIAGMRGTEPSVDLSSITAFTDRLDGAYEGGVGGVFAYGAETYDAIVIIALAAAIAGSDDPAAVAAEINGVTKDGEACTTFADCIALVEAGTDIDYDGQGGPYEFVDAGEPAAASFRVATYDGGDTPNTELDEYLFAS